jgi:hypothetical protein
MSRTSPEIHFALGTTALAFEFHELIGFEHASTHHGEQKFNNVFLFGLSIASSKTGH